MIYFHKLSKFLKFRIGKEKKISIKLQVIEQKIKNFFYDEK